MTIRESPDADLPAIVRLRNQVHPEQMTVESLQEIEKGREDDPHVRFVADIEGRTNAFAEVFRNLWIPPGVYRLQIVVDEDRRGRGIGTNLYNTLLEWTQNQNIASLEAVPSDEDPATQRFCSSRGFKQTSHTFESVLDLATFDPAAFATWHTPEARIFTFAETDGDEAARRKLWTLNTETSLDEPHNDPLHVPTFEDFDKNVIGAAWFDPAGQFLAEINGEWVGMSAVGSINPGSMLNFFTGVVRWHRGKGLAKALKLQSAIFAKHSGAPILRTNNDSRNAPMLAINRQMGYTPRPGWIFMRRDF